MGIVLAMEKACVCRPSKVSRTLSTSKSIHNVSTFLLFLQFVFFDKPDTQFDAEYLFFLKKHLLNLQSVFQMVDIL